MTDESRRMAHIIHDAVGVGTPITVTSLTVLGIGLQDWVYIFTLVIASMQIVRYMNLAWGWWKRRKTGA